MNTLTAQELKARLDRREDLVLLDVLPRVSFDRLRLPQAEHASFYDDDFLGRVAELAEPGTTLVTYCVSSGCNASSRAAAQLLEAGYRNVYDFDGGIREWRAAGYPVLGSATQK